MNCILSFSAEKEECGEIAAQHTLARNAVRISMCVAIGAKITFMSHAVVRVGSLNALITSVIRELISKLAPCLPAHVILFPGVS